MRRAQIFQNKEGESFAGAECFEARPAGLGGGQLGVRIAPLRAYFPELDRATG
jgi:hypothetical protein